MFGSVRRQHATPPLAVDGPGSLPLHLHAAMHCRHPAYASMCSAWVLLLYCDSHGGSRACRARCHTADERSAFAPSQQVASTARVAYVLRSLDKHQTFPRSIEALGISSAQGHR